MRASAQLFVCVACVFRFLLGSPFLTNARAARWPSQIDVEPCADPAQVSLDILDAKRHIDFPIKTVKAGEDVEIPIPDLSIVVPKIGSLGLVADIAVEGDVSLLNLKVGLNACGKILKHTLCASQIPIVDKILPVWVVDHSFSFGHICTNSTRS